MPIGITHVRVVEIHITRHAEALRITHAEIISVTTSEKGNSMKVAAEANPKNEMRYRRRAGVKGSSSSTTTSVKAKRGVGGCVCVP